MCGKKTVCAVRVALLFRVVSRGKLSSQASDFGGLEVFGGASIGHTDPLRVIAAVDKRIGALGGDPAFFDLDAFYDR